MSFRSSIVAVILVLGVTAPTSAIVIAATEDSSTDSVNDVELSPSENPNGRYATISNDTLELTLEDLNDRAITHADDVVTVTVTNETVERVWIEHNVSGLTFYHGDDPDNTISRSTPLAVSAGDTEHIGVVVNTHVAQDGTETFTLTAQYDDETDDDDPSPDIERTALNVSSTTVETGETITATATYRNVGSASSEATADLTVDGTVVDQRTIDLVPGEERTVTFERTMYWPGTYEVGITGAGTESVAVGGPPIDVVDATVAQPTVTAGDSTTIEATVRNPTDRGVDRTLEVAIDGIVVDTRSVSIPANGERTVTFQRGFQATGTYEVAVSGVAAGEVSVGEPGGFTLQNRELAAATTAALAPPATAGLMFLAGAANRRWAIVR